MPISSRSAVCHFRKPARLARALGESASQYVQGRREGNPLGVDSLLCGRFLYQNADNIVAQQKPVNFLQDPQGGLAPQNRSFSLMGLQLVDGQFFFPALVIEFDQRLGWIQRFIKERGQQSVHQLVPGTAGIIEGVFDDPHDDPTLVFSPIARPSDTPWLSRNHRKEHELAGKSGSFSLAPAVAPYASTSWMV